jgi:hypothetical protein
MRDEPVVLWDRNEVTARLIDEVARRPRQRLSAPASRRPGVYLLVALLPDHDLYGDTMAGRGEWPLYCGRAKSLAVRLRSHVATLAATDLDPGKFAAVTVPAATFADATYFEETCIDHLPSLWNQTWLAGFGNRRPGHDREEGPRRTPWGTVHPGRRWERRLTARDRDGLVDAAAGKLADLEATQLPLWEPLTTRQLKQ